VRFDPHSLACAALSISSLILAALLALIGVAVGFLYQ
jgi:hypothetical protein